MAVSKNNRKKGKKRTANHSPAGSAKQPQQTTTPQSGTSTSTLLKGLALLFMIAGLAIVYYSGYTIGFPLSIAGAVIGLFYVRKDQHFRFVTRACYGVFIAVMICYWISSVHG